MSAKAVFRAGEDVTTTNKLHQWDYGQTLEIEAYDLPFVQEVHFACPEMTEAIVRPCSTTNGIVNVKIPDVCLEQSSTITAWMFVIEGTEGMTKKTIMIPVEARTRPSPSGDVPVDVWNQYTELISEINEVTEDMKNGNITVAKANVAGSAGTAGHANTAGSAETAETAGHANTAGSAETAETAGHANTAESLTIQSLPLDPPIILYSPGLYMVEVSYLESSTSTAHYTVFLYVSDPTNPTNFYRSRKIESLTEDVRFSVNAFFWEGQGCILAVTHSGSTDNPPQIVNVAYLGKIFTEN